MTKLALICKSTKNGSFNFAEWLAPCVGAKTNVQLWVGNCLKNAWWAKSKKH
ncbi:MAG: hypothetical protein JW833_17395 [Prolixibacteraceae bacterium]|nr:hypothetical protein [Prolixibacteraceae bacterium]